MTLNESRLSEFGKELGVDPKSQIVQCAFGAIQALYRMTTDDVEEGEITCTYKKGKLIVSLVSDCFCMRAPFLGEFLSYIQFAEELTIKKEKDGFQMLITFAV